MDSLVERDSPLSTTSSVAGILTFIVAIVAAFYVRMRNLRNSREDFFRVKASLSWYKTESAWLAELISLTAPTPYDEDDNGDGGAGRPRKGGEEARSTEYHMYAFVMEDLERLEARLLELVAETEVKAADAEPGAGGGLPLDGRASAWTLVPRGWTWSWNRTTVAMAWLPVRSKALELVRQRDALTARVQFAQMSMIAGRIRALEGRAAWRESKGNETLRRLEALVTKQQAEMHELQDQVRRNKHKRSGSNGGGRSPVSPAESPSSRRGAACRSGAGKGGGEKGGGWEQSLNVVPIIRRPLSR